MKMSDVWPSEFSGVDFSYGYYEMAVTAGGEEFSGSDEYPLCGLLFTNEEPAKAVMHAVQNHDALVEALKSARHMLWAAKNNMQNDGSPESLELAVMIAKEDLRELDKMIEKFEGES